MIGVSGLTIGGGCVVLGIALLCVVIVAILILSTIGWGFHELIRMIERRALIWHVSQRTLGADT